MSGSSKQGVYIRLRCIQMRLHQQAEYNAAQSLLPLRLARYCSPLGQKQPLASFAYTWKAIYPLLVAYTGPATLAGSGHSLSLRSITGQHHKFLPFPRLRSAPICPDRAHHNSTSLKEQRKPGVCGIASIPCRH